MSKLLQVRPHVRKSPRDPNAEAKERMTRLLEEYVIFRNLERELSAAFDESFADLARECV